MYRYCFDRLKRPSANAPEQLLVPVYVPEIVVFVTPVAVPLMVAVQAANPETPPAGTEIVNVSEVPVRVPVSVPVKMTTPSEVFAVTGAEIEPADCDTVHVIVPAPLESEVEPE